MKLIKIGLANLETHVGAFRSNTEHLMQLAACAAEAKDTLCIFPEMSIPGYPCEDNSFRPDFVQKQWDHLIQFTEFTKTLHFPTVFFVGLAVDIDTTVYNCAAVICNGNIWGIIPKSKLANSSVYYDERTFGHGRPGFTGTLHFEGETIPFGDYIFQFPFGKLGVTICEDIWTPYGPAGRLAANGATVIVNLSASHFEQGKPETRRQMLSTRSADYGVVLAYVSQVGGYDSLAFDGHQLVFNCGRLEYEGERWCKEPHVRHVVVDVDHVYSYRRRSYTARRDVEELRSNPVNETSIIEVEIETPETEYVYPAKKSESFYMPGNVIPVSPRLQYMIDLVECQIMTLESYFDKVGAFKAMGLALSGGYDSCVVLAVARILAERRFNHLPQEEKAKRIREFLYTRSMPTRFNGKSREIARNIATEMGVAFDEVPIDELVALTVATEKASLQPGQTLDRITLQNIQARIRGTMIRNWANHARALVLQTSNMTEVATGYSTKGGDNEGDYGILQGVPKEIVIAEAHYLADLCERHYGWTALNDLLSTRSSAELEGGQYDEDELGSFFILAGCEQLYLGELMSPTETYRVLCSHFTTQDLERIYPGYKVGMLKKWVRGFCTRYYRSIHKQVESCLGSHHGSVHIERDRTTQVVVAQSLEWLNLEELEAMPDI